METEFIYWSHNTPAGIKVEEVSGAEDRSGLIWREMALQIYCENGRENYRQIGHYQNGAPFLEGEDQRISITHTDHLLAIATLPRTPEADLRVFSPRTAMGIDAERADRAQVIKIRSRFLSETELKMISEEDVALNVLAWTVKEAMYKAAFIEGLDFRAQIKICSLPEVYDNPVLAPANYGQGTIVTSEGKEFSLNLFSWRSDDCIVTLAFSPSCAKNPSHKCRQEAH